MGLFSFFNKDAAGFGPFLKRQLITQQQYDKLTALKARNKPHSQLLNDYTPECLLAYIAANTERFYNHTYFKRSYIELIGRKPYWAAEAMDRQTEEKIRNDHKILLQCLRQSGLISSLTYEKIAQQTDNGIIYKPWEMIRIAQTLTAYEEELQKINIETEIRTLLQCGALLPSDAATVVAELRKGNINEKSEVIRRFGVKTSIPGCIAKGDVQKHILALLDASLQALPFYKYHNVKSIDHYEVADPYHKNHTLKHTSITLVFNHREYFFPVNCGNSFYPIAPGFTIGFFYHILAYLCREHGAPYEVVILKDYFLDQHSAENENIQTYYLLLLRKGTGNSFFLKEKMSSSIFSTVTLAEKKHYLDALFALFDEGRLGEPDKEFAYKNIIPADIATTASVPYVVPHLIHIVWYDILSEAYSYKDIIADLASISKGRFQPEKVTDGFAFAEKGETFEVSLQIYSKTYTITLIKDTVDYDLFRLVDQVQSENDLGGKFYTFNDGLIEDGYALIFLSDSEMGRLNNTPLFKTAPLAVAANVWINK